VCLDASEVKTGGGGEGGGGASTALVDTKARWLPATQPLLVRHATPLWYGALLLVGVLNLPCPYYVRIYGGGYAYGAESEVTIPPLFDTCLVGRCAKVWTPLAALPSLSKTQPPAGHEDERSLRSSSESTLKNLID